MGRLRRRLLLTAGFFSLALGMVGVVLPVVPTTPFVILAVLCFARSSRRCHQRLVGNRVFGRYVCDYLEGRGIPWKARLPVLGLLWTAIILTALLIVESLPVRVVLILVAVGVTIHVGLLRGPGGEGLIRREVLERRSVGLAVSVTVYGVAAAVAVSAVSALPLEHPLARLGVGTVIATLVVFGASRLFNNSSIYDPYWSLQPFAIAVTYLWWVGVDAGARGVVVAVLTGLYAARLTVNFYRGWAGLGQEDFRYRRFRQRFGRAYWPVSFMGIHLFPTTMVWLGCLPLYGLMRSGVQPFGWVDVAACVLYVGAVGLSLVADEQLRAFRRDPANREEYLRSGLWSHSRHPNYLGEIASWWGLWLFALGAGVGWWWTGIGAVAITLMFVFVSVTLMEARNLANRPGYDVYLRRTPMLLPWRRRPVRRPRTG